MANNDEQCQQEQNAKQDPNPRELMPWPKPKPKTMPKQTMWPKNWLKMWQTIMKIESKYPTDQQW